MRRRPMRFLRLGRTRAALGITRNTFRLAFGLAILLLLLPATAAADDTQPIVTYSIDGIAGTNSWYRGSTQGNFIVVHWSAFDPDGPLLDSLGCGPAIQVNGPNAATTRTCWAKSAGGETTVTTKTLRIDADPPTDVAASATRAPDFNGWYNHPVGINWGGADATSGLAGCTSLTYGGPDSAAAPVGGGCTDMAGNTAMAPIALNYDATPPVLSKVSVASGPDLDVVGWTSSSPSDTVVVQRIARGEKTQRTVFRGTGSRFADKKIQDGLEYTYSVQTTDQAGNASKKLSAAGLPKVLTLGKTPYIPRAARNPILSWKPVRGARYYNVQLFRGSKRIFAAWPRRAGLGLPTTWKWAGHRYRLSKGRYRWYVWAGVGPRSFARYKTLGNAQFIVPGR
jgi:hypothetical protein